MRVLHKRNYRYKSKSNLIREKSCRGASAILNIIRGLSKNRLVFKEFVLVRQVIKTMVSLLTAAQF
ncbi:hypothetical protein HMPREF9554_02908 [Treponema phagedenis F0421]|nr:hypothetical protein HMPREF9554_02908 [Treponema phagedenis F0421]